MEKCIPSDLRKWLRKCLEKEFEKTIQNAIDEEQECSNIAYELTHSKDMATLLNSMKMTIAEQQHVAIKSSSAASRSQSSLSFTSDLTIEDWTSPQGNEEQYDYIIDKISRDKPVHVRLAGYEILLKIDLTNVNNSSQWDVLQKTLLDGLTDDSRAIFEASLQVHAKLLSCPQLHSTYGNLLNAFNDQYHSQKMRETLPTLISGINFKFFLHEKLFCIMYLIIHYHEEMLKSARHNDKTIEEILEQFIIFLSTHTFGNVLQSKTLNTLNIISVMEPQAKWSKAWLHSFSTRRIFVIALTKSPTLLQNIVECVQNGLQETPCSLAASIVDEGNDLCIPGNTIETATYLHCLIFISQLCRYEISRVLLSQNTFKIPFDVADFLIELSNSLDKLAMEAPSGVYNASCDALQNMLNISEILYNTEFYHVALCRLISFSDNDIKIWPHTLNIISHMVDTIEGPTFLTTNCKEHSESRKDVPSKCPVAIVIQYASNLLKQPFFIMDVGCIINVFKLVEKLFDMYDVYDAAQEQIETQFYPAVSNFYKKLNKYGVENENKIQQLDSAIKKVLLRIVSIPLGLQAIVNEKIVFEELIHGLIVPLRASWSSTDIVSFISSAGYFDLGYSILADLAPHVLSTLLSQICANIEDPVHFYDPWDRPNINEFLHILTLFSLNFNCFAAFMTNNESDNDEEKDYLSNLSELLQTAVNEDSSYHYLGLLSLSAVIWNLDICVYLLNSLNFQEALLNIQKEYTIIIEIRKEHIDDETDYEESTMENNDSDKPESTKEYIIDDLSLLRHDILLKTYYVTHKKKQYPMPLEEYQLFSEFPPPRVYADMMMSFPIKEYDSELQDMLQDERPGLLDISWVSQVRMTHKVSRCPMQNSVIRKLLHQMHKAIPTAEWVEQFEWQENITYDVDYWVPEDIHAINIILNYAEQQQILKNTDDSQKNLKQFIHSAYIFIQYNKPNKFEGFDWFLATVFIICDGDLDEYVI